jgi:hypothetical protein
LIGKAEWPDARDGTVASWSSVLGRAKMSYVQELHRNLAKNKKPNEAAHELTHGGVPDPLTAIPPPKKGGSFRAGGTRRA